MSHKVERYWWYRAKCDAIEAVTDELIAELPQEALIRVSELVKEFYTLREQPDFNTPEYNKMWGEPFNDVAA
jgi:hypothetical protein